MIFIGPNLLSGIGQVTNKYCELFNGRYQTPNEEIIEGRDVFIFALPIEPWLSLIPNVIKKSKRTIVMTVCETEPVHEAYGSLFQNAKGAIIVTPSDFCKRIFESQFNVKVNVLHHTVPLGLKRLNLFEFPKDKYIFYHIGNIIDQRKNVKKIIEAFLRLNLPNALLVLKATCHTKVTWNVPGVIIINGLLDDLYINELHETCHCYVSFSSSEGVGMGAVEAAVHDRPVIITDYGAPKEYIKTDYLIPCGRQEITCDDFLFKKGFTWGKPDFEYLLKYMKECYDGNIKYVNHQWTRDITNGKIIKKNIRNLLNGMPGVS